MPLCLQYLEIGIGTWVESGSSIATWNSGRKLFSLKKNEEKRVSYALKWDLTEGTLESYSQNPRQPACTSHNHDRNSPLSFNITIRL